MKYFPVMLIVLLAVPMLTLAEDSTSADALVQQLGDSKYSIRQEAAAKLRAMGTAATDALERAAKSSDPEISMTATAILNDLRFGITPGWPEDLANEVRGYSKLDDKARIALMCRISQKLGTQAVPFLVNKLSASNDAEARTAFDCLKTSNRVESADAVINLKLTPQNQWQAKALGWAYMKKDRPLDALKALTAQKADDQSIREISVQAVAQMRKLLTEEDYKGLEETAGDFAKANPSEARFLYLHAISLAKLGKKDEADKLLVKALALNPEQEGPHFSTADMLMELGLNELSLREWDLILKIPPENDVYDINAYLRKSQIYERLQNYSKAADNMEEGLKLFKARKTGGGGGYGMIGGNDADLEKRIKMLRELAQNNRLTFGDDNQNIRLDIHPVLKSGKAEDLVRVLSSSDFSMNMNIQPVGLRLLDEKACTLSYNKDKGEISVKLNNTDAAVTSLKIDKDKIGDHLTVIVYSLDCVYVMNIDTESGDVKRTDRFEMDYSVKIESDDALKDLHSEPTKIGEKTYTWEELLKGTTFDYLPPSINLNLKGKNPDGTERNLQCEIRIGEKTVKLLYRQWLDAASKPRSKEK